MLTTSFPSGDSLCQYAKYIASFPGSTPQLFSHRVEKREKSWGVEPGNEATKYTDAPKSVPKLSRWKEKTAGKLIES